MRMVRRRAPVTVYAPKLLRITLSAFASASSQLPAAVSGLRAKSFATLPGVFLFTWIVENAMRTVWPASHRRTYVDMFSPQPGSPATAILGEDLILPFLVS